MNTQQLVRLAESCAKIYPTFLGVFASDRLPSRIPLPCSLIANLDTSEEDGSHWVCFHFPTNGLPEYMDSYGIDALDSFKRFMNYNYRCNSHVLQNPFSAVCGQYCLYYLYQRTLVSSMDSILANFRKDDYEFNDTLVNEFVDNHFNVRLPMFDYAWQLEQISKSLF